MKKNKRKLLRRINKIMQDIKENKSIIFFIAIYFGLIIFISILFYKIPQFKSVGIYDSNEFWVGILLNLNSGIIEFIIFSILLVWLVGKIQKQREIRNLKNILDMNRGHSYNDNIAAWNLITLKKLFALEAEKINLTKLIFRNNLGKIDLVDVKLMGTIFKEATLIKSSVTESDLNGARFIGCILDDMEFKASNLKNVKFIDCSLISTSFNINEFRGCEFINCEMRNVQFNESNLDKVKFTDSNLSHANFSKVNNLDKNVLNAASNLNRIKIDRSVYGELQNKYPQKFGKNK